MSKLFTNATDNFKQLIFSVDAGYTGHFICGQSNGQSASTIVPPNDPIYPGQSKRYQGGVVGGPIVDQKEYLNESIASTMTNRLIDGYRALDGTQPILITENHAVGGRDYEAIKKGGTEPLAYAKFITEITAIQSDKSTVVKSFHLVHGEADLVNPWIAYRDNLVQFLADYTADCKLITGQVFDPIMIVSQISSQQYYQEFDVDAIKSPLALLDVCRVSTMHYSCGPQYWCVTNGGADQYHLSGRDQIISGEYRAEVIDQVLDKLDTTTPTATMIKTVTLVGSKVVCVFDVPLPPLKWDTDYMPAIADNGFVWSDDSGAAITGVSIVGNDTVEIQLNGVPTTNPDLQYAWHNGNHATGVVTGGPRGTLADSATKYSKFEPDYLMRHYALAFRFGTGYLEFS